MNKSDLFVSEMDTCSDICVEVGDCVYILKDTALCVCNVPVKHFCRVTSATLTITVKGMFVLNGLP